MPAVAQDTFGEIHVRGEHASAMCNSESKRRIAGRAFGFRAGARNSLHPQLSLLTGALRLKIGDSLSRSWPSLHLPSAPRIGVGLAPILNEIRLYKIAP